MLCGLVCGLGEWVTQPAQRVVSRRADPCSAGNEATQWRRRLKCSGRYQNNESEAPFACHRQCFRRAWAKHKRALWVVGLSPFFHLHFVDADRERVGCITHGFSVCVSLRQHAVVTGRAWKVACAAAAATKVSRFWPCYQRRGYQNRGITINRSTSIAKASA